MVMLQIAVEQLVGKALRGDLSPEGRRVPAKKRRCVLEGRESSPGAVQAAMREEWRTRCGIGESSSDSVSSDEDEHR